MAKQKSDAVPAIESSKVQLVSNWGWELHAEKESEVRLKTYQIFIEAKPKGVHAKEGFTAEAFLKNGCLLCFQRLPMELADFLIFYLALDAKPPVYSDDNVDYYFHMESKQESLF